MKPHDREDVMRWRPDPTPWTWVDRLAMFGVAVIVLVGIPFALFIFVWALFFAPWGGSV